MQEKETLALIKNLTQLSSECEWVEFKLNDKRPQSIGEYLSALSNSACLHNKDKAYLIFGVNDTSHEIEGTTFKPSKEKVGNQEIENWLATQLNPRIDFKIHERLYNEKDVVVFEIDATINRPVEFRNEAFIRVGSYKKKLNEFPEKERKIWQKQANYVFEKEFASSEEKYLPFKIIKAFSSY